MGTPRRVSLPPAEPPDYQSRRHARQRRGPHALGQLQHRRELRRHYHAADVQLRPQRLPSGLPTVLRLHGGGASLDRRELHHLRDAGTDARPYLLQPAELVPRTQPAPRLRNQRRVHGADDGRRGGFRNPACAGACNRQPVAAIVAVRSRRAPRLADPGPRDRGVLPAGRRRAGQDRRASARHPDDARPGGTLRAHRVHTDRQLAGTTGQRLLRHDLLRRVAQGHQPLVH